jgi:hypothetical protein
MLEGREVLLAGVDFDSELTLKRWWHVAGNNLRVTSNCLSATKPRERYR